MSGIFIVLAQTEPKLHITNITLCRQDLTSKLVAYSPVLLVRVAIKADSWTQVLSLGFLAAELLLMMATSPRFGTCRYPHPHSNAVAELHDVMRYGNQTDHSNVALMGARLVVEDAMFNVKDDYHVP